LIRHALSALALLLAPAAMAQEDSAIINPQAIAPFLTRLPQAAERPLHILQLGDSHTAGDMLTQGWRQAWQTEYGAGGRGMMPVGRPYQGYLTWGVTAGQSEGWSVQPLFGKQRVAGGPANGLSGFTQSAQQAGASLTLRADSADFAFNRFSLCGLTGPDKGAVHIVLGEVAGDYSFAAPQVGATCFDLSSATPVMQASITTLEDKPVSLTAWDSRRDSGLVLSNLGVVGSKLSMLARMDEAVLAAELRHARPDLLVIAFGTNEGFDPALKLEETEAAFRSQIARLRRLAGADVPILLLGPPDAASSRADVSRPDRTETVSCGQGWAVPAHLAQMRAMEQRLALEMNLAFWDWQQAMGGPCSSSTWVAQGLQRGDHVHFSKDGGRRLGEALAGALDRARAQMAQAVK
jgi:lysophospholipase L1-like esterase